MIHNRDARNLKEFVGANSVDVIVTSPPYANLKDYGSANQIGFGQNYRSEYLPALSGVFRQCFDVAKNHGTMWLVADTFKKEGHLVPLPFELAALCEESGWRFQDVIIWDKGKTLPWSHRGRLRNVFEYILFFSKGEDHKYYPERIADPTDLKQWWVKYPERYAIGGKNPSNIWRIRIPVQGSWSKNELAHACPFPTSLVERILLLCSDKGDVVLDPFAGSGTVVAQAQVMGRRGIGLELNPEYIRLFKTVVLPETKIRFKKESVSRESLVQMRSQLGRTLRDLRLLKYGKVVYLELRKKSKKKAGQIVAIVASRSSFRRGRGQDDRVELKWLLRSGADSASILREIARIASRPPASKFGIDSTMSVAIFRSTHTITNHFGKRRSPKMFVYEDGRTHFHSGTLKDRVGSLSIAVKPSEDTPRVPPIISPIGVRQRIPKTWRSENGG